MADEIHVRQWTSFCQKHQQSLNGFYYFFGERIRAGRDLTVFACIGDSRQLLDDTVLALKSRYNIATSIILLVPPEWLPTEIQPEKVASN